MPDIKHRSELSSDQDVTNTVFFADFFGFLLPANEVWGKVISLQASVCPQGGVPDQVHPQGPGTPPDQTPPLDQMAPEPDTPQTRHPRTRHPDQSRHPPGLSTPPGTKYTPELSTPPLLRDTVNVRAVQILLECNLVTLISCQFQMIFT